MTIRSSGQTTITKLKNAIQSLIATKANKTNGVSEITDSNSDDYTNISSMQSGATQQTINDSVNIELGKCIKKSQTSGLIKNDGTIDTSSKENISNKVSSWSGTVTNDHYPSEKLVKDSLDGKVNTNDSRLIDTRTPKSHSHGNISNTGTLSGKSQNVVTDSNGIITTEAKPVIPTKTSDLTNDSGFLTSHNPIDSSLSSTSTNAVQNKVINTALNGKADSGHSHYIDALSISFMDFNPITEDGNCIYLFGSIRFQPDEGIFYTNSNGDVISFEDFAIQDDIPTIPSASSSTPSADVSGGAVGSSSNYAKADHQHPLSSAYATSGHTHTGMLTSSDVGTSSDTSSSKIVACNDTRLSDARTPTSHTHTYGNITGVSTVEVLVTYTDDTTETLNLLKYTSS